MRLVGFTDYWENGFTKMSAVGCACPWQFYPVCREKLLQLSLCLVYRGLGAQLMVISLWGMEILQVLLLDSLANTSLAAMSSS